MNNIFNVGKYSDVRKMMIKKLKEQEEKYLDSEESRLHYIHQDVNNN